MKRKLTLLIATCSIVVSITSPIAQPVPDTQNPNLEIMKPNDHGFGT
ncbi:hypothetical protein PAECIP112173_02798 [Paenibacillus sp. JJ-100]|nr:hypothetical protein PAECIP112173_02798 [Paenibacillus sp. JJ-100]